MIIRGKSGMKYVVKYQGAGWSYAQIIVFTMERCLWFRYLHKVWTGSRTESILFADKLLPQAMERWFQEAVDEYEEYVIAWKNYNERRML